MGLLSPSLLFLVLGKEVQRPEALFEEAELEILQLEALRLEALRLNPLKAQELAVQTQVQRFQLERLRLDTHWILIGERQWSTWRVERLLDRIQAEHLLVKFQLEDLRHKLLRRVELIQHFLGFLAMLWQKLLESLLFSHNASEFPNKHRPPCTTMPWNIRLALVVLWGVCWMFYPWSPTDDIQLQPLCQGLGPGEAAGRV
jgi:hypothetical protein